MDELEQQREALETRVLQEQIEKSPITREQILFCFDQLRHGDPADMPYQANVIDCFVNSIYLFDDRIVLNFNYQEGGRPVSLEEVLGSFLDEMCIRDRFWKRWRLSRFWRWRYRTRGTSCLAVQRLSMLFWALSWPRRTRT